MQKSRIIKILKVLIVLQIWLQCQTESNASNNNPYPATSFEVDGIPYLAYQYPHPATNVIIAIQGYEFFLGREKTVSNIIDAQERRYVSFKKLDKAQKKKRIGKGLTFAGVFIDTVLKSFFIGYGYSKLQSAGVFP